MIVVVVDGGGGGGEDVAVACRKRTRKVRRDAMKKMVASQNHWPSGSRVLDQNYFWSWKKSKTTGMLGLTQSRQRKEVHQGSVLETP